MTISVSLSEELVIKIREAAQREHRSISGQIAYYCDQGMIDILEPHVEDSQESNAYGQKHLRKSAKKRSSSNKG